MAAVITRIGSKRKPKIGDEVFTINVASNVIRNIPISHILKIFCMEKNGIRTYLLNFFIGFCL